MQVKGDSAFALRQASHRLSGRLVQDKFDPRVKYPIWKHALVGPLYSPPRGLAPAGPQFHPAQAPQKLTRGITTRRIGLLRPGLSRWRSTGQGSVGKGKWVLRGTLEHLDQVSPSIRFRQKLGTRIEDPRADQIIAWIS